MIMFQGNSTNEAIIVRGVLHEIHGYYVSNEGTKADPCYTVWVPGLTYSTSDSAYNDLSLAIARCNYIAQPTKTVIMFASNKKEAIGFIRKDYNVYKFIGLYKHVSKGNNFYEFQVKEKTK